MTQYNHPEYYDGRSLVLDDTTVMLCCSCGALVLDTVLHSTWHADEHKKHIYGG